MEAQSPASSFLSLGNILNSFGQFLLSSYLYGWEKDSILEITYFPPPQHPQAIISKLFIFKKLSGCPITLKQR